MSLGSWIVPHMLPVSLVQHGEFLFLHFASLLAPASFIFLYVVSSALNLPQCFLSSDLANFPVYSAGMKLSSSKSTSGLFQPPSSCLWSDLMAITFLQVQYLLHNPETDNLLSCIIFV